MRRLHIGLLLVLAFLWLPSQGWGAVAYDATANGQRTTADVTIADFTLTIGSITNGAVGVGLVFSANTATGITVTIGGVSATLVSGSDSGTARASRSMIYALATGSTTGAQTVSIAWTGAMRAAAAAVSMSGVNQSTPTANGTFASGTPTPSSVTVTSATGNLTLEASSFVSGNAPTSPTQTSVYAANPGSQVGIGVSRADGGATVVHGWSNTGSAWTASGVDLVASTEGAVSSTGSLGWMEVDE